MNNKNIRNNKKSTSNEETRRNEERRIFLYKTNKNDLSVKSHYSKML